MDRQEIRMRCLEVAQIATKTPAALQNSEPVLRWAREFEAYVVGDDPAPKVAKVKAAA